MSEPLQVDFGPCTRCPKVGRTDESGKRGRRDSSHYYCKQCRAEYQKTRYVGPTQTVNATNFVITRIDAILDAMADKKGRLRLDIDPIALLTSVHEMVEALKGELVTKGTPPGGPIVKAKERRGPANQTYDQMVADYDRALEFGNAENARIKRAEIQKHFPEYGLPGGFGSSES